MLQKHTGLRVQYVNNCYIGEFDYSTVQHHVVYIVVVVVVVV